MAWNPMAWNLQITGPAQKEFQKLPAKDRSRVKSALLAMQHDPFSGDGDDHAPQRTACRVASPCRQLPHRLRSPHRTAAGCYFRNPASNLDDVLKTAGREPAIRNYRRGFRS